MAFNSRLFIMLIDLVVILCLSTATQATLVLPVERSIGLGCIQEGMTVSYECTITDFQDPPVTSTIWRGTAFKCPTASESTTNQITLRHTQPFSNSGECGSLSAMGVGFIGNNYTSRLTLTATVELNELTVICTLNRNTEVGRDTIKIGAVSPLLPRNVTVKFTSSSSLTVRWTPPSDDTGTSNVGGYMFTVTGEDCGCETMNVSTSNVLCSDWTVNDQTCIFEVRTISTDCGFVGDAFEKSVTLTVPVPPSIISVSPVYRVDGSVKCIDVVFTEVNPVMIGGGVSSKISYTVMIGSLPFTGVQCNTSNQQCNLTVLGSQLIEDGLLNVSVVASNAVGNGDPVSFPMSVPANFVDEEIVNVTIIVARRVVLCEQLDSFSPFFCTITYGPSTGDCATYTTNSSTLGAGVAGDTVMIELVEAVISATDYCYTISVSYGSDALFINGVFRSMCNPEDLGSNPISRSSGGTAAISFGQVVYSGVIPGSTAVLTCDSGYEPVAGSSARNCMSDGNWSEGLQSCMAVAVPSFPWWIIAVVIVLAICVGICAGYLCGVFCQLLYEKIRQRKCTTILLILLLCIAFGFGLGLLLSYCCCGRKKKGKEDKRQLGKEESHDSRISPPPPDSLYADPNTIEHEAAPGTEDQYAMVDRKVKKNTKPKPTPPEALYQDPNTIEHKTAASGDTYAVVDKPKRSSKKKGGPDVVPPASEGLTYAEIDLSSKRPKPGSGRQAPQQPGEYPKEHPVEYSSVDHGNTSQL